jgi:DNA-binding protein Fis
LNEQDRIRNLREKARNALETYVIDMQTNIFTDEYEKALTEAEKEKISQTCSEVYCG